MTNSNDVAYKTMFHVLHIGATLISVFPFDTNFSDSQGDCCMAHSTYHSFLYLNPLIPNIFGVLCDLYCTEIS